VLRGWLAWYNAMPHRVRVPIEQEQAMHVALNAAKAAVVIAAATGRGTAQQR